MTCLHDGNVDAGGVVLVKDGVKGAQDETK